MHVDDDFGELPLFSRTPSVITFERTRSFAHRLCSHGISDGARAIAVIISDGARAIGPLAFWPGDTPAPTVVWPGETNVARN